MFFLFSYIFLSLSLPFPISVLWQTLCLISFFYYLFLFLVRMIWIQVLTMIYVCFLVSLHEIYTWKTEWKVLKTFLLSFFPVNLIFQMHFSFHHLCRHDSPLLSPLFCLRSLFLFTSVQTFHFTLVKISFLFLHFFSFQPKHFQIICKLVVFIHNTTTFHISFSPSSAAFLYIAIFIALNITEVGWIYFTFFSLRILSFFWFAWQFHCLQATFHSNFQYNDNKRGLKTEDPSNVTIQLSSEQNILSFDASAAVPFWTFFFAFWFLLVFSFYWWLLLWYCCWCVKYVEHQFDEAMLCIVQFILVSRLLVLLLFWVWKRSSNVVRYTLCHLLCMFSHFSLMQSKIL